MYPYPGFTVNDPNDRDFLAFQLREVLQVLHEPTAGVHEGASKVIANPTHEQCVDLALKILSEAKERTPLLDQLADCVHQFVDYEEPAVVDYLCRGPFPNRDGV